MSHPFVVLASRSPRRRELLQAVGVDFIERPVDTEETRLPSETPPDMTRRLAAQKARASFDCFPPEPGQVVLGADTIVVLDGEVLGKPQDADEGIAMLRRLSGRTHEVFTGVCVMDASGREWSKVVRTPVTFRAFGLDEIRRYVATGEAGDKAGSYAAQGRGVALIERVEGSYTNVIGLPVTETLSLIDQAGRGA